MLKRLLILIPLLLAIGSTSARDAAWTAWLYDDINARMVLIESGGRILQDLTLPVPWDSLFMRHSLAVSPSGTQLAYITYDDIGYRRLAIYDTSIKSESLVILLPRLSENEWGYYPTPNMFNEDETALAVGYILDDGHWQIDVYDLASRTVTYTLHDTDVREEGFIRSDDVPPSPSIQQFQGTRLTFSVYYFPHNGPAKHVSFDWDLVTDMVTDNPIFTALDYDIFVPTGEIIVTPDSFSQEDWLYVYTPAERSYFPFYYSADGSLSRPRFVQNGERILVTSGGDHSLLVERDGTLVAQFDEFMASTYGLANGFIYTANTTSTSSRQIATEVIYVRTRDGDSVEEDAVVWRGEPGNTYAIVWAKDDHETEVQSFMPWAQLAEPIDQE